MNAREVLRAIVEGPSGHCTKKKRCRALRMALDGQSEKERTGLVEGLFPPHVAGVRFKKAGGRSTGYANLIFAVCPFCAKPLPQGAK